MRILLFLLFFTAYSAWSKPAQIDQVITPQSSEKSLNENDNTEKEKLHEGVPRKELRRRGRLWHLKGSDTPYTGKSYSSSHALVENSIIEYKSEANWKDGQMEGPSVTWHPNGQKFREEHYKDGRKVGLQAVWYSNGEKWP